MNEAEWIASTDPAAMLAHVQGKVSDRKLRLFACSCCRQVWDGVECRKCGGRGYVRDDWFVGDEGQISCGSCRGTGRVGGLADPRSRNAVDVAERFADGLATEEERYQALVAAHQVRLETGYEPDGTSTPAHMAHVAVAEYRASIVEVYSRTDTHALVPPATQASLLRCIAGNPFRPVPGLQTAKFQDGVWHETADWLTHNDGAVVKLARAIYDSRDWGLMPILADALEEAGCVGERCSRCNGSGTCTVHVTNAGLSAANGYSALTIYSEWRGCRNCGGDHDRKGTGIVPHPILAHLRGPGPHGRGCWALDLLLGRE